MENQTTQHTTQNCTFESVSILFYGLFIWLVFYATFPINMYDGGQTYDGSKTPRESGVFCFFFCFFVVVVVSFSFHQTLPLTALQGTSMIWTTTACAQDLIGGPYIYEEQLEIGLYSSLCIPVFFS